MLILSVSTRLYLIRNRFGVPLHGLTTARVPAGIYAIAGALQKRKPSLNEHGRTWHRWGGSAVLRLEDAEVYAAPLARAKRPTRRGSPDFIHAQQVSPVGEKAPQRSKTSRGAVNATVYLCLISTG